MRRLLVAAAAISAAWARDAWAQYSNCEIDYCQVVPRTAAGAPILNHTDPTKPFVIGGTENIVLSPGDVAVGVQPELGTSMIYVIGRGKLRIENHTGDQEVRLGAMIVLCDDAQLTVANATLRVEQPQPFAYPLVARDRSRVVMGQATLFGSPAGQDPGFGLPGYFCESSTLTVAPGPDYGVRSPGTDMLEWVFSGTSVVNIDSMQAVAELYAEDRANVTISNSDLFAMWLNPLPSATATAVSGLPGVCDLGSTTAELADDCFGNPTPPSTNYSIPAGAMPFRLAISNSRVFSWGLTTWPGSNVRVDVGPEARLAIGTNLQSGHTYDLMLVEGQQTQPTGLDDRQLELGSTSVALWHVWGARDAGFTLRPGSATGDFAIAGDGHGSATRTTLKGGILTVGATDGEVSHAALFDSTVDEPGFVNGVLRMTRTAASDTLMIQPSGLLVLEDSPVPSKLDLQGELVRVALVAPEAESFATPPISIRGSISHRDRSGELPLRAIIEVRHGDAEWIAVGDPITTSVTDAELATFTPAPGACGDFAIRARVEISTRAEEDAIASRTFTIACEEPDVDPDEDAGCAASPRTDASGLIAVLVGLSWLRPRRSRRVARRPTSRTHRPSRRSA